MADKISFKAYNSLEVPNEPIIPFIVGDGIGPDLWRASVRVFDAAVEKAFGGKKKVQWMEVLAGQKAYDQTGAWLPAETLQALKDYLVSIKGPLTTPIGEGIRSINVSIRQQMDLYVCLRPLHYISGVPSPVKHPERVDMVIFRENTEDIYAGIEFNAGTEQADRLTRILKDEFDVQYPFKPQTSLGIKPVSQEGSERLIEAAIRYAIDHGLPSVTLVHKGNIMKYTEGGFKKWGYQLAKNKFSGHIITWDDWEAEKKRGGEEQANAMLDRARADKKVLLKDVIADNFLQQIILNPQDYSVIATLNLNGDYISDAVAAVVGGIGIAPGGNINYETGHAVFEATHGTAPRFADTDTMNPSSLILSGAMLFDYLGWNPVASRIREALARTIAGRDVTVDFYNQMENARLLKTSEFADRIISML